MAEFRDIFAGIDLKCDFPARESFREELLARLLDMDTPDWQAGRSTGSEVDLESRELSDSDLELLAAAQGEPFIPKELLNN